MNKPRQFTKEELDSIIVNLLKSPAHAQEFMDIFSFDQNWDTVNKEIKVPRGTGFTEGECPQCDEPLRTLHQKFCSSDAYFFLVCPHCKEKVGCHLEFTGYTCDLQFEEYDEDVHGV
ncbi:hypothetical protein GF342_04845 [Candidatus Woesearchaeota archaeon]|nr:hypothetical protein [Candidatus Woesearchaeota archaeon]